MARRPQSRRVRRLGPRESRDQTEDMTGSEACARRQARVNKNATRGGTSPHARAHAATRGSHRAKRRSSALAVMSHVRARSRSPSSSLARAARVLPERFTPDARRPTPDARRVETSFPPRFVPRLTRRASPHAPSSNRYSTATRESSWSTPRPSTARPRRCRPWTEVRAPPASASRVLVVETREIPLSLPRSRSRRPRVHPPADLPYPSLALIAAAKSQKIAEVDAEVAEAEALVRRMDLEARSLRDPTVKTPMLAKLRDYKSELQRLKRESQVAARAIS